MGNRCSRDDAAACLSRVSGRQFDLSTSAEDEGFRPVAVLAAGLYAWLSALLFGAALLDIVYSRQIRDAGQTLFREAADLQLLISVMTAVAAIVAVAAAWRYSAARKLLGASVLFFAFSLITPAVLAPFVSGAQFAPYGAVLRIIDGGLVTLLGGPFCCWT
ncbi:MAG: hypothetical protein ACK2UR_19620 [Candidatus Promineifilaceae bacterium]